MPDEIVVPAYVLEGARRVCKIERFILEFESGHICALDGHLRFVEREGPVLSNEIRRTSGSGACPDGLIVIPVGHVQMFCARCDGVQKDFIPSA